MKTFETTVLVLLLAILALHVYSAFYKTKESYCPFGDCTPSQPDPSFDPMTENYGFEITSGPGLPTSFEIDQ